MPPIRRGPVVRDLGEALTAYDLEEGELEVVGSTMKSWSIPGEDTTVVPSRATAAKFQAAMKDALKKQLEKEASTLGDIGAIAIHGRTGVST